MDFFTDIISYRFLTNALLGAILVGIACGIVGTYMVTRRMVFLGGGITHSSFGGIGMAYHFGVNPIWGALLFAVVSALAIERIAEHSKIREDSAIGILWSIGMAVGVVFIVITPGYAPNLMSFLFGNILLVGYLDLLLLAILDVALLLALILSYRAILYTALDKEFAQVQGYPVRTINYLMMIALALAIVFTIKAVGIMLLMSLLTIPPVVANLLSNNYRNITWIAGAVSIMSLVAGIAVSYNYDIPAGAATVILLGALFLVMKAIIWLCRRKPQVS